MVQEMEGKQVGRSHKVLILKADGGISSWLVQMYCLRRSWVMWGMDLWEAKVPEVQVGDSSVVQKYIMTMWSVVVRAELMEGMEEIWSGIEMQNQQQIATDQKPGIREMGEWQCFTTSSLALGRSALDLWLCNLFKVSKNTRPWSSETTSDLRPCNEQDQQARQNWT